MSTRLELNKKYTKPGHNLLYTCVGFTVDGDAILEKEKSGFLKRVLRAQESLYKEYVEPEKIWVNIYQWRNTGYPSLIPFTSREMADLADKNNTMKRVACIPLEYCKGDGL